MRPGPISRWGLGPLVDEIKQIFSTYAFWFLHALTALPCVVFKDGGALKAEIEAEKEKKEEAPVYIPVVGESEPELKYIGPKGGSKDKGDQKQTATDDAHFEKYKKKFKM